MTRTPHFSVNGVLLLDKPVGMTSNAALQKVKRLFFAKKAGHTGSLDPLASGLLPLCFGEATKFSQYLLEADKSYSVTMQLGVRTTTSDAEGEVISERPVPEVNIEVIDRIFDAFRGESQQIPSMFSALKHNGKPLYELARQGITVPRHSRSITIYALTVESMQGHAVHFTVRCSKGTYVRTLVDDFGEILGCGAHVIQLRRLSVGPFTAEQMLSMDHLEGSNEQLHAQALQRYLLPIASTVMHWPEVIVPTAIAFYLLRGQSVFLPQAPKSGWMRLVEKNGGFLGVGEVLENGKIAPRRLVRHTV